MVDPFFQSPHTSKTMYIPRELCTCRGTLSQGNCQDPYLFQVFFCVCGCPFSRMLETQIFSHLDGLMLGDVLLLQWVFDPGDDPPILGAHLLCHLYNQEFVLIFGKPASQIRPFRFLGICLIFFLPRHSLCVFNLFQGFILANLSQGWFFEHFLFQGYFGRWLFQDTHGTFQATMHFCRSLWLKVASLLLPQPRWACPFLWAGQNFGKAIRVQRDITHSGL